MLVGASSVFATHNARNSKRKACEHLFWGISDTAPKSIQSTMELQTAAHNPLEPEMTFAVFLVILDFAQKRHKQTLHKTVVTADVSQSAYSTDAFSSIKLGISLRLTVSVKS